MALSLLHIASWRRYIQLNGVVTVRTRPISFNLDLSMLCVCLCFIFFRVLAVILSLTTHSPPSFYCVPNMFPTNDLWNGTDDPIEKRVHSQTNMHLINISSERAPEPAANQFKLNIYALLNRFHFYTFFHIVFVLKLNWCVPLSWAAIVVWVVLCEWMNVQLDQCGPLGVCFQENQKRKWIRMINCGNGNGK